MLAQIVDAENGVFDFFAGVGAILLLIGAYLGREDHGTLAARVGAACVFVGLLFL